MRTGLLALAVLSVLVAGCAGTNVQGTTGGSPGNGGGSTGQSGSTNGAVQGGGGPSNCATPPAIDGGAVEALVAGNTQLALDLFGPLAADPGANVVVSPLSVSVAMAMLQLGARGPTADQIARVMHLPPSDALGPAVGALDCQLAADGQDAMDPDAGHLALANALFVRNLQSVPNDFRVAMSDDFGAHLAQVNFDDPAAATATLNDWVSVHTDGLIPALLGPGQVNSSLDVVLVNALVFTGRWQAPFPTATPQPFYRADGGVVSAPTLSSGHLWASYADADGYKVLELGTHSQVAVDLLLPDEVSGLPALKTKLTASELETALGQLQGQPVDVSVPKLHLDFGADLVPQLKALGLTLPFGAGADLSGLGAAGDVVEFVQHQAVLTLEEGGIHAAAATAIGVGFTGGTTATVVPPTFHADHPFLLLVRDVPTGSVLFMAQVVDPTR